MVSYFLDTHALLALLYQPESIDETFRSVISSENEFFYSFVQLWEITMLRSKGRIETEDSIDAIHKAALDSGLKEISVIIQDLVCYENLVHEDFHKDPFDKLLVAICMQNDLTFITADKRLDHYPVSILPIKFIQV